MAMMSRSMTSLLPILLLVLANEVRGQEEVNVKWGVADATASVGRPFRLHIPSDAFTTVPLAHSVRLSEGGVLPSWLEFDTAENVLQGIPTPKDIGQIDLEIVGKGPVNEASTSFSLLVRDVQSHTGGSPLKFNKKAGPEYVRCKPEEPETVATIILDIDMDALPGGTRMSLLKKFLGHMELAEDMVKMVPVGKSPMHDDNALVSGTGDSQTAPQTAGTFISWPVGCGQVKEGHFPILQRLDDDSRSGRMARSVDTSIIGWHVTNSHIHAPKRKRRQAGATATAVMSPAPPTETDKTEKTDDGMDKLTRTVVDMESPVIKPTATQPEMTKTDEPTMPPKKEDKTDDKIKPTETEPVKTETKPTPPIKPTTTYKEEPTGVPEVDTCIPGQKPMASNTFSRISYQVGKIIDFVIPEDAFEDCEVGDTRGLTLGLFTDDMKPLPGGLFFQLDKENQKIIGLPMENDAGRYKLTLVAKKMSGEKTLLDKFTFVLIIKARKNVRKINHELSVTIDYPFDKFKASVVNQTNLANKIAQLYGDPDASNLVVTKMEPGSVQYGWANKSAMGNDCPLGDIGMLVGKLFNQDGQLTKEAIDAMDPFFLSQAGAAPSGSCEGKLPVITSERRERPTTSPPVTAAPKTTSTPKPVDSTTKKVVKTDPPVVPPIVDDKKSTEAPTMKPKVDPTPKPTEDKATKDDDKKKKEDKDTKDDKEEKEDKEKDKEEEEEGDTDKVAKGATDDDDDDDILITTVVPAVVIVVILLIALLIACCLYRKKRKGKMNVEEQNTFVNKGVPVILPNELEEPHSDVNKPLLVEGGSPAPPPGYHRDTSASPELDGADRNNYNNTPAPAYTASAPPEDGIHELPERPYEPPAPPVTGSGANRQPRPTQQPMSQPPQILP